MEALVQIKKLFMDKINHLLQLMEFNLKGVSAEKVSNLWWLSMFGLVLVDIGSSVIFVVQVSTLFLPRSWQLKTL